MVTTHSNQQKVFTWWRLEAHVRIEGTRSADLGHWNQATYDRNVLVEIRMYGWVSIYRMSSKANLSV